MDMANLQLKMQQMQQQAANQNQLFKGTNGPSGAANYLAGIYGGGPGTSGGDSASSSAIMNAINDVMSNPNVIAGKYDTGQKDMYGQEKYNNITDAYLIDLLRQRMSGAGQGPLTGTQFSDADINNAINALLAYQGKLK
jgi:hypothetical protein